MTTNDTLRVTDSRTGRSYELPIVDGAIRAIDLRQIKTSEDDFGLLSYDPAFQNTASVRSAITFIDGEKGILRYRGYPIEELAGRVPFLDVAALLINGELPGKEESAAWADEITQHTFVHENVKKFIDGFHHDAHPMGILVSTIAALSTFYPGAKEISDTERRHEQIVRLIAKMPTLAAFAYRHAAGLPYAYPDDELSYAGNFLSMMRRMTEPRYSPDPVLTHALDVLFTLHADHEQNCSTSAMRVVGSSRADPYSAAAAATAALYGPLHGGANEQVMRTLTEIRGAAPQDPVGAVEREVARRLAAGEKIMGFGHRVYKTEDPRATHLRAMSGELAAASGDDTFYRMSRRMEETVLAQKGLLPNVDFYAATVYHYLGIPTEEFTAVFSVSRMAGWTAHVMEQHADNRLIRPDSEYIGERGLTWIPVGQR